jgi:hypothetical protein
MSSSCYFCTHTNLILTLLCSPDPYTYKSATSTHTHTNSSLALEAVLVLIAAVLIAAVLSLSLTACALAGSELLRAHTGLAVQADIPVAHIAVIGDTCVSEAHVTVDGADALPAEHVWHFGGRHQQDGVRLQRGVEGEARQARALTVELDEQGKLAANLCSHVARGVGQSARLMPGSSSASDCEIVWCRRKTSVQMSAKKNVLFLTNSAHAQTYGGSQ